MQQTEKYKLNLIEPSDPFLPDALNANTQQLEEVVSEHLEAMDQRVTVLEGRKLAFGTYQGNGQFPRFIPLPFTPKVVFVKGAIISSLVYDGVAFAPEEGLEEHHALKVVEGGFQILYDHDGHLNNNLAYCYIALA